MKKYHILLIDKNIKKKIKEILCVLNFKISKTTKILFKLKE